MTQVDPITLEVVRGHLVSTVYQMRVTLLRTAYSPMVYETLDFSCGLLTPNGELLAMSEDTAGHVFAMSLGLDAVLEKFEGRIYPGDVLAVNDPYTGGTHMNDVAFYAPFFVDEKLLLFIAVRAHWADIGGATPGSFSGQDTEIYQEGMRIVPVKFVERGQLNRGLWDVLFANMRIRDEQEGDALAMLDTARVAHGRISELCDKYGTPTIDDCIKIMLDQAEESIRAHISQLPPGEYYYEHYMDNGGLSPEPMPIKSKLTIEGDTMTFDFTGTAGQVVGPMNCGRPVSQGGVYVVVKSWLDPKTPVNGGTFRPLKFVIPEGSCLAAQLPAAVGACWEVWRGLQASVVGLFSQIMPDQAGGENPGGVNHMHVSGFDEGRGKGYIFYEYPGGGIPGTSDTDGATGTFTYDCGDIASVFPAESSEQRQPVLIESLVARIDGESPGRHRSGFGVTRRVRLLSDGGQLNVTTDRAVIPPWGTAGAYPGSVNSFTVIRGGHEIQPSAIPGKVKEFRLEYGDVLLMQASAGGGVGDPLERDVELVRQEVFEDYVTHDRARDVYGVVIQDGQVDRAKTQALRQKLSEQRRYCEVIDRAEDDYDERGCRLCILSREAGARIGARDGDMVEYVSKTTAPLRAWVKLDDGLAGEGAPIGPIGRSILRLAPGDKVWLRSLEIKAPAVPLGG